PGGSPPKWMLWLGRVLSALPVLGMIASGAIKLSRNASVVEAFGTKFGYPTRMLVPIGVLEIACALVYAIPRTAGFGAVLVPAYLGAAVAPHVRISDNFIPPVVFGIFVWVGLVVREPRWRALVPLRRPAD